MEQAVITAELRQKTSKGENKRLRKEGKIPGVLYGKGKEAASIVLSARQLQQVAAGEGARLLKLQLPGEAERTVLLKDIQYDHLYKNIHHVDLQEISLTEKITVTVPLVLAGKMPERTTAELSSRCFMSLKSNVCQPICLSRSLQTFPV